jgi:hypothetical protein
MYYKAETFLKNMATQKKNTWQSIAILERRNIEAHSDKANLNIGGGGSVVLAVYARF